MKCPKDNNELTIQSKEGVVGYCCDECHGIFLKGSGMKAFKINFETEVLESTFKISSNSKSDLSCSSCNTQMQVAQIDEIEIDICQHCHGVWFDTGEAEFIISRYRKNLSDIGNSGMDTALIPFPLDMIYSLYQFIKLQSRK